MTEILLKTTEKRELGGGQVLVEDWRGKKWSLNVKEERVGVSFLKETVSQWWGIPSSQLWCSVNGKPLSSKFFSLSECSGLPVRFQLRVVGGKGGFGALLRGAGAKPVRNVSCNDCRDLSGRRIRHIKNETKLAEWYRSEKQNELEKEKEKEVREKEEKEKKETSASTSFNAAEYHSQLKEISESIEHSVLTGLKEARKLKGKEKSTTLKERPKKKVKRVPLMWSEFDEVDDEDEDEAKESSKSTLHSAQTSCTTANSKAEEEKEEEEEEEEEVDLSQYETAEAMESLGLEQLKVELQRRNIKCGGTLQERAARLFAVWDKPLELIDQKLIAKPSRKRKNNENC